jgi:NADPH:quinone reductase-like Zn-dependent oxidoreductase
MGSASRSQAGCCCERLHRCLRVEVRPFGTAAEFTVVPLNHVAPLPRNVSPDQGACLGIPGITAHRAVHVGSVVSQRTVLVPGARGPVGMCAVLLARRAGARVIGTVRSSTEEPAARAAGAHEVILNDQSLPQRVKALAAEGVDHIVEVAFGANIGGVAGIRNRGTNSAFRDRAGARVGGTSGTAWTCYCHGVNGSKDSIAAGLRVL